MNSNAVQAYARFGFGRRPDDPEEPDPQAWLLAQLAAEDLAVHAARPNSADRLAILARVIEAVQARKQAGMTGADMQDQDPDIHGLREGFRQETHDILGDALITRSPFRERLVWFWANHFTIAARDRVILAVAGPYIREVIRPHVTGRFRDMLLAVMRHPAMLAYLDQMHSAGPGSAAGLMHKAGLNENLARECLELHTVTPASGYTQADVTAFAKVLTGWSVSLKEEPLGFRYRERAHEPGEQVVMGRRWPEGEAGGIALLGWLADHPATHRHLAEKLVRHFVADEPPPAQVRVVEAVLRDTGGDLGAAAAALVTLPGAWTPLAKLRTPQELVVATLRATGTRPEAVPNLAGFAGALGQPVLQAPFPIGWPDRASDWANPEAMLQRVDFAFGVAGRNAALDPIQVADSTLGPLLHADTMAQLRAAGSRRDALTLLFSSPEFQRR